MSGDDLRKQRDAQQKWQAICLEISAPGREAERKEACQLMAAQVRKKSSAADRIWLLKQLERIGGAESVDALDEAAGDMDDVVRNPAQMALAANPSPEANKRLLERLATADDKRHSRVKTELINALGYRADPESTSFLAMELANSHDSVAIAAAKALGKIATAEAAGALTAARRKAEGEVRHWISDSYLLCADALASAGKEREAAKIYAELDKEAETASIRAAAQRGLSAVKA